MDFGVYPPEINSARMYSGPGSGPMVAAATAWDALAVELYSTATNYELVVSELIGTGWRGPASLSMAAAAKPFVAWLHATAAQAEQTAAQAKEAAAAYELAFAMTVPPPVIAANRGLLMTLVATNFFGQNTPAIAATEAIYAEMWIQDAVAMYGYAGSSAAASQLSPFTRPNSTTNQNGVATQYGAVAHATSALQELADPTASPDPPSLMSAYSTVLTVPKIVNTVMSTSSAVTSGRGIFIQNSRLAFQEAQDAGKAAGRLVSTAPMRLGGSTVWAGMGRSISVGTLAAPPNWAIAAPEIRNVAFALPESCPVPAATTESLLPGSAFSQSVLGTLSRCEFDRPRVRTKPIIVRTPAAG
ncbi:PPE family protein [Mycobacterium shimoidei]|uniref:PPE family protein n=1 Tax=Mycobacterium shimoidei TaxID=29313 RepID=UPI0039F188D5